MGRLEEDVAEFGMGFEGWRNAAKNAGRWVRRVEEEEAFVRKRCDAERRRAAVTSEDRDRATHG